MGIEEALAASRRGVRRLTPVEAMAAVRDGALLVDTRTEVQRAEQGELLGALVIDRTVLDWRLDPACETRIPEAVSYDTPVVVVCRQGYSSSLAAASLRALGLHRATDVIGGVEAWVAADLPLHRGPADVRRIAGPRDLLDGPTRFASGTAVERSTPVPHAGSGRPLG